MGKTPKSAGIPLLLRILLLILLAWQAGGLEIRGQASTPVSLRQETFTLPTYEEGMPDPNPPFEFFGIGRLNYPYTLRYFGIEFNFPVSHNWMTASPVDFACDVEPDKSASVWIGNIDRVYSMHWLVRLRRALDHAGRNRCRDAQEIVTRLTEPVAGLRFTQDGMEALLKHPRLRELIQKIASSCPGERNNIPAISK